MALRTRAALGIAGLLAVAGGALVTGPANAVAPGRCDKPALSQPARAGDLQRSNPGAFRSAEARNAGSVPGLASKAADKALWVDRCLTAFYVDATAGPADKSAAAAGMGAAAASATDLPLTVGPLSETFTLQSKPGSSKTIYLDFKGGTITGTAWNASYGATLVAEPYSIDTTVDTSFSDAELTEIQKVWQVVAEDYAPYDVNVTTQDPGSAAIDRTSSTDTVYGTRALITNGGTIYTQCSCGGIAYVNVFNTSGTNHGYYQPAWIFSNGTTKNGKYIGEAVSHEVGHNFGLNHDGTATSGYYSGANGWAPIMGASYSQPISQWSKGEYPGANNTTQDDVAQIATGAAYRTDEDAAGPVALGNGGAVNGIVAKATDVDSYAFTAAGSTTVAVANASGFPDLDVLLTIRDASGAVVATANPASARVSAFVASGLGASATFTAPAGGASYTAQVQGTGQGDPATPGGYSSYGSLGNYQVSLATQTPSSPTPLSVSVAAMPSGTVGTPYGASPVSASGGTAPYSYGATGLPTGISIDPSTGAVSGTPTAAGTWTPVFTVTDSLGASASRSGSVTINPAAAPPPSFVTGATLPTGKLRTAYTTTIQVTGGTPGYTWARTAGSLPAGLTLTGNGATATISGTPTKQGSSTFTVKVTDAAGASVTKSFTLQIRK
ncbi:MAG: putative Ig domain-containing protein [Nocardioidaceae bacterium]|nr:putative Ig domain-containing protein [Nocardioidaceae bacterium]